MEWRRLHNPNDPDHMMNRIWSIMRPHSEQCYCGSYISRVGSLWEIRTRHGKSLPEGHEPCQLCVPPYKRWFIDRAERLIASGKKPIGSVLSKMPDFMVRPERKERGDMYSVCIDPGVTGTGIAIFRVKQLKKRADGKPTRIPIIAEELPRMTKKWYRLRQDDYQSKWMAKVDWYAWQLRLAVANYNLTSAYMEFPEQWGASEKSQAAAQKGDLMKLAFLCGAFANTLAYAWAVQTTLLFPRDWKGQMSKKVVAKRVRRAIHRVYESNHITEAVGMGIHLQGRL